MAWRNSVTTRQDVEARVAAVRFEGLDKVSPEYLRTLTTIKPGDDVDIEAISADAMRMSALEDLDTVAYRLEGDPANPTLVWLPSESSVGPERPASEPGPVCGGGGDVKFLLGAQYVRHWLNDRGGQWRTTSRSAMTPCSTTSFYQPFDMAQRFFVEPELFASRRSRTFSRQRARRDLPFIDMGGSVDFGVNLGEPRRYGLVT